MHYINRKYRIVEQAREHILSYLNFHGSLVSSYCSQVSNCHSFLNVIEHDCLNFQTKSVLYFTLSLLVLYYCMCMSFVRCDCTNIIRNQSNKLHTVLEFSLLFIFQYLNPTFLLVSVCTLLFLSTLVFDICFCKFWSNDSHVLALIF